MALLRERQLARRQPRVRTQNKNSLGRETRNSFPSEIRNEAAAVRRWFIRFPDVVRKTQNKNVVEQAARNSFPSSSDYLFLKPDLPVVDQVIEADKKKAVALRHFHFDVRTNWIYFHEAKQLWLISASQTRYGLPRRNNA
jgi:hypothetical protein